MANNLPSIKDIIKDNTVHFVKFRQGYFYYSISVPNDGEPRYDYLFPVPQFDISDSTLLATDKAIIFMRYIRKAIEEGTFVPA
jgi:hypothetical protein